MYFMVIWGILGYSLSFWLQIVYLWLCRRRNRTLLHIYSSICHTVHLYKHHCAIYIVLYLSHSSSWSNPHLDSSYTHPPYININSFQIKQSSMVHRLRCVAILQMFIPNQNKQTKSQALHNTASDQNLQKVHARSQEFSSGGPRSICHKKGSDNVCLVMYFKENYNVRESNIFQGRGGELFISYRNPYNLWFSRGCPDPLPLLWLRAWCLLKFREKEINTSNTTKIGTDKDIQVHSASID